MDWSETIPVSFGIFRRYTRYPVRNSAATMGSIPKTKLLAVTAPFVSPIAIKMPV